MRVAEAGAFRPLWSDGVLQELRRNLVHHGIPADAVDYRIGEMRAAFPDAEVTGYELLVPSMSCDEKDRHVLAAAVRANADVLVTFNLSDFPEESTKGYDVTVMHPDAFLLDQLDLYPGLVLRALNSQAASYRRPAMSVSDLLLRLTKAGIPGFARETRRHL